MHTIIYHNPRCSKSRQALEIMRSSKINFKIVKYLETPPTAEELGKILQMLGLKPDDIMRKHEAEYKASGLDKPNLSDDNKIKLMVENPKIIERPIVVNNGKAVIGRPPENIKSIL